MKNMFYALLLMLTIGFTSCSEPKLEEIDPCELQKKEINDRYAPLLEPYGPALLSGTMNQDEWIAWSGLITDMFNEIESLDCY